MCVLTLKITYQCLLIYLGTCVIKYRIFGISGDSLTTHVNKMYEKNVFV